jgi:hypothetical protein
MGFHTWTIKVGDSEFYLKMEKDRAKDVAHRLQDLLRMGQFCRTISNNSGPDYTMDSMSLFTPSGVPIRNPETYPQDVKDWFATLPVPITEADLPAIFAKRKELYELHVPIKDERLTPEARAEKDAETAKAKAEWDAKAERKLCSILSEWGSGSKVTVPADHTAVILQQVYDNSHLQSDYFDRHHTHGPAFLLGYVPGKAVQSEALARGMVARYPGLLTVNFEWKTEKYSMGHGNYLESTEAPGSLIDPDDPNSGRCGFEVQFAYTYTTAKEYHPWQTYPGKLVSTPVQTSAAPATGNGHGAPRLNADKGGVEIHFSSKPAEDVLAQIKGAGWRWSKFGRCWYTKDSPRARQFAETFTGVALAPSAPVAEAPGPDTFDMLVEDAMAEAAGVR